MFIAGGVPPAQADPRVLVFSAGSLTSAVAEIVGHCARDRPEGLAVSYAASGVLARQIEQGAAADLFISANVDWMDYLDARGLLADGSRRRFAGNTLVVVVPQPPGAPAADAAVSPADLFADLSADARIAMGDPAYVPAGAYAKAGLEHFGHWAALEGRIAGAPTVRAALALVEAGAAPLGIVFATDARISRRVRVAAVFPPDSHPPIVYEIALIRDRDRHSDTAAARAVFDCLGGADAASVLADHGFAPAPSAPASARP